MAAVKEAFTAKLVAKVKSLKIGSGLAERHGLGPLATAKQLETVLAYVEVRQEGSEAALRRERLRRRRYDQVITFRPRCSPT